MDKGESEACQNVLRNQKELIIITSSLHLYDSSTVPWLCRKREIKTWTDFLRVEVCWKPAMPWMPAGARGEYPNWADNVKCKTELRGWR